MSDLDSIKKVPILEVAARLAIPVKGLKAICFNGHDKRTPSLSFNVRTNTWKCFGACGTGGSVIDLVMEKEKLSFKEALNWFAANFFMEVTPNLTRSARIRRRKRSPKPAGVVKDRTAIAGEFSVDPALFAEFLSLCSGISSP